MRDVILYCVNHNANFIYPVSALNFDDTNYYDLSELINDYFRDYAAKPKLHTDVETSVSEPVLHEECVWLVM
jgi:hypothetical protein